MSNKDENASKSFSPNPYIVVGYLTVFLVFGVFGTWAMTAPLASGVVASGTVSIEGNRKTVQHLEGGIISKIAVKEGDFVEIGAPLLELDDTQALGNYSVWKSKFLSLKAQEARLLSESSNNKTIDFPTELLEDPSDELATMMKLQEKLFQDRLKTRNGQIAILEARIGQLNRVEKGFNNQMIALNDRAVSMQEELDRLKKGRKLGVVATNQLSRMTRDYYELQSDRAKVEADIAKTKETISETHLQILQTKQEFSERAVSEYKDTRDQLREVEEKTRIAQNVLKRTIVRAPIRGKVQSLRVHTQSGVIRPADPLMDIVPTDDDLIINSRVRPIDIDNIHPDADVEVRFAAFSNKTTPVIMGKITVLSKDVIESQNGNDEPYYLALVKVSEEEIPEELKGRLVAGMPADVVVSTGDRTLVEYLIKPLLDSFYKGMKEK
ncbi:MAG: HlyD family type I secretion periplasmic adaptor subunit [Cohaesibacter sp.]|nr:HlyD family type I secretion periplasmic adaptor subunit [Cohaesibacter sp.]